MKLTPHAESFAVAALTLCVFASLGTGAFAQDGGLYQRGPRSFSREAMRLESASLFYNQPTPVKKLQLHDIVTVEVNINSRVLSEGEAENRKLAKLSAVLSDWIVLDGLRKVIPDPQSAGNPKIAGQLNSQFRAESDLETRNSLTFTIAAKVVDVRPNGNLVVEARQQFQINEEIWERSLTGVIRREDVTELNVVKSEDIAELRVYKREVGHVRDGYRRGWFQRLYDRYMPF